MLTLANWNDVNSQQPPILSSQVVSLPFQFVIQEVANFCAAMDTLIDQDEQPSSLHSYIYVPWFFAL